MKIIGIKILFFSKKEKEKKINFDFKKWFDVKRIK